MNHKPNFFALLFKKQDLEKGIEPDDRFRANIDAARNVIDDLLRKNDGLRGDRGVERHS